MSLHKSIQTTLRYIEINDNFCGDVAELISVMQLKGNSVKF